jgi:hypothetical protein
MVRCRSCTVVMAFALLAAAGAATAQTMTLNPEQQKLHDIYKELLEINTVDSVGSTTVAAAAMQKRFLAAGFPASDVVLLAPKPDKGNLVVRYHGTGTRTPLLLLAHLDVVAALKSDWTTDPFTLVEKDGYYYARGSGDDKAMASIFVANMLRMKREGFVPDRDIILALTADEKGGDMNGAEWLVNTHKPLIDAAYALNEGGGGALKDGKPFLQSVQATEKVAINLVARTHNRGGHSSVPRPDNAIYCDRGGNAGVREERARCHGRRDALGSPALQLDASHHLRRDETVRWPREQRAPADGDGDDQLPHRSERRSGAGARNVAEGDGRHRHFDLAAATAGA